MMHELAFSKLLQAHSIRQQVCRWANNAIADKWTGCDVILGSWLVAATRIKRVFAGDLSI